MTYEWVTEDAVTSDVIDPDTNINYIENATSDNVITDRGDRYKLTFFNDDITGESDTYLEGGDTATVTLTTAAGASTIEEVRVPDSLVDRQAVKL